LPRASRRAASLTRRATVATIRIGINGFGRIGRNVLRACLDEAALEFVAVNDITDAKTLAHLLKFDSVHGVLARDVRAESDALVIDRRQVRVLAERDPARLPWKQLGVDLVLECSGLFTDRDTAAKHLEAAAKAIGLVLPELNGKLDGMAVRVRTPNVSLVDLTAELERPATEAGINDAMREAASGPLKGILLYCDQPLVSSDFNGTTYSSIFDSQLTRVLDGTFCKVLSWYDNEWGFSNR